ncbi:hypothetical protein P152DRAFT_395603, partial [Eremomyces bilateralis CBS 781.70]
WSLLVGILVVIAFCVASYFLAPKGEDQLVWRSSLMISATACYLMWAITFLAQWHPLIVPQRNDLRPEYLQDKML